MDLIMANGNILVQKIDHEVDERTQLVYTEDQRQRTYEGRVMATTNDSGFEIGDVVLFSEFSGESVYIDGADYLMMNEEDVWGKRTDVNKN